MEPPSFQHKQFIAGNIRVFFPFDPYSTQREYATSIVDTLNKAQNAILESPTGTGKTLSLLCSTLAWLQAQNGSVKSIVYYTSRTHIQLAQAAKELKRTAYAKIPSVVIGSRAQMCLNHEVRQQGGDHLINRACRNAIAKNACEYHANYEQKLETIDSDKVVDIEDLMDNGQRNKLCPYYASKKLAESKSTVIFMPYNYLLDPSLRRGDQLKLENSVIIFDEAHNIDSALKDAVSGDFTQSCLKSVQDSCQKLPEKVTEALNYESHGLTRFGYDPSKKANKQSNNDGKPKKSKKTDEPEKVNPIEELATKLTVERLQQVSRCAGSLIKEITDRCDESKALTIDTLLDLLKSTGIYYETSDHIITTLESMSSFWSIAGVMNPVTVAKSVASISALCNFITLIFPDRCTTPARLKEHEQKLKNFYTSYLEGEFEKSPIFKKGKLKDWKLSLWCLHPAVGMRRVMDDNCIKGPRSLIITSGTLAPLASLEKELELTFSTKREFEHIIGPNQLKIFAFAQSPSGHSLLSDYNSAKTDTYKLELGKTLLPLLRVLPYGTLVFFPSYGLRDNAIKFWKEKSTIWRDMQAAGALFIESKDQATFNKDIANYKKRINENRRAIYFCVCRGKLSEGVNLDGNQCRTVVLTGLPFPNISDPRVQATKAFNEDKRNDLNWYSRQMTRALNQTIGRVIRNKSDYGMLILCDPRFTRFKLTLSEWTRPFFPTTTTRFENVEKDLKEFFEGHGIDIRESVSESHGAFEIGLSDKQQQSALQPNNQPPPTNGISNNSHTKQHRQLQPNQTQPQQQNNTNGTQRVESIGSRIAEMVAPYAEEHRRAQEARQSQQSVEIIEVIEINKPASFDTIFDCEFIEEIQAPSVQNNKRPPPKSTNIFKKKPKTTNKTNPPVSGASVNPTSNTTNQEQIPASMDYSIYRQNIPNNNTPKLHTCYVCKNPAFEPVRTNCPCAHIGCRSCLSILDKKSCGKCKTKLRSRDFAPLRFIKVANKG